MLCYVSACPAAEAAIRESAEGESRSWGGACYRGEWLRKDMHETHLNLCVNVNEHEEGFLKTTLQCWHMCYICFTYVWHISYDSRWFTYVWRDACLMRQLCHTCLTVGNQCKHVNMCPHVSTFNGTAHSICRPQHRRLPAKAAEWLRGEAPCMKPRIACSPQLYEVMCFQCLTKGFNAFRTLRNSEEMARASLSRNFGNLPQLATLCISHSATLSWGISAGAKRHCA